MKIKELKQIDLPPRLSHILEMMLNSSDITLKTKNEILKRVFKIFLESKTIHIGIIEKGGEE